MSIPQLRDVHQKYKDKGVVVVALSFEDSSKVRPYVAQKGIPYAAASGTTSSAAYGVHGYPSSFVINPEGKIVWAGHPMGGLAQAVEAALEKTPPTVTGPPAPPDGTDSKTPTPPAPIPGDPEARQKAAAALLETGRTAKGESKWVDAWSAFEKAVKTYPETAAAADAKKEMDALKADPVAWKAIEGPQKAVEAARLLNMARMALKNGDADSARRYFDEVIAKYPGTPQALEAKTERPR